MQPLRSLASGLIFLLLCACGGGGGSTEATVAVTNTSPPAFESPHPDIWDTVSASEAGFDGDALDSAFEYAMTDGFYTQAVLLIDKVQIDVSDTGPGLIDATKRSGLSTGVGLTNIRDRLAQAYGAEHRFEARSIPGGGFRVEIEIPFQIEEPKREAA